VKHTLALTILPLLVALANCSGNGGQWGSDDSTPTDDGGATDDGTTPGDDAAPPPPPSNAPLATGLSVTGVAVDQAVEVNVVKNGAPVTKNAPIVAGRRGVVRVFVNPSSAFSHSLTGVLTLHTAGSDHVYTASLTPKSASSDSSFSSTFNFSVDAAGFGTDTTFLVQIKDPKGSGSGDSSAQFPTSGTPTSLGVQASGSLKIKVIPIHFSQGGGTPATGAIDINAYQSIVMSLYPVTDVTITVGSTYTYTGSIPDSQDNNSGWDYLLSKIQQQRAADPTPDVYYYGAFAPTSSFASYCGNGCIAGLSGIPSSPSNYSQKASIGLVYGGDSFDQTATGQTMAHEVGHGHGREHSPTNYSVQGCSQPSGIDPSYPYANGAIGVWGYNLSNAGPVDPSQYFDIMGYCAYDWISDYTYRALFSWIAADNGADMIVSSTPVSYRMISVKADGSLENVSDPFPVYGPVTGDARTVTFDDSGVTRTVTGYFTPFDHVGGGTIMVKDVPRFTAAKVRVDGQIVKLAK